MNYNPLMDVVIISMLMHDHSYAYGPQPVAYAPVPAQVPYQAPVQRPFPWGWTIFWVFAGVVVLVLVIRGVSRL
jgi:hypothetical protein